MKKAVIVSAFSLSVILILFAAYCLYRINAFMKLATAASHVQSYPDICIGLFNNQKKIHIRAVDMHSMTESRISLTIDADFGPYKYSSPVLFGNVYAKKMGNNKVSVLICPGNPELGKLYWDGVEIIFQTLSMPSDNTGRIDVVALEEMVRREELIRIDLGAAPM